MSNVFDDVEDFDKVALWGIAGKEGEVGGADIWIWAQRISRFSDLRNVL